MLKLIPFEAEHAKELCPDAIDSDAHEMESMGEFYELCDAAYTGMSADGKIVCAFGIVIKKDGVADVWSIFTQQSKKCPKSVFKTLVTMLDILIETFGLKKLRSQSRIGFQESQQLLEHLGFKRQRRNMINGKNYFYARGA